MGIGGARRGLGVVLDREARCVEQLDALGGAVVEVHMCQANATKALVHHDRRDSAAHPDAQISIGRMLGLAAGKLGDKLAQAGEQQAKAMVLRGDLHTAAYQVHNRLVATAVTELKLFHLGAAGQADHLVTETNTKDRHLADQLLHLLVGLHHGVGVAGAIGQKDAVGIHVEHLTRGRIPRHDGKIAAGAHQALQNAALHTAVVGDHFVTGRSGSRKRKVMRGRQVGGHKLVRRGAAYGLDQVLAYQRGRCGQTLGKLVDVEGLGRDNAHLGTIVAQMAHQSAGVDALDSDDAVSAQVLRHAGGRAPVRRRGAHVANDHAAHGRSARRAHGVAGEGRLDVGLVDTVVADLRIGHGYDLAGITRVGHDLKVALERGVEADFAGRGALGAACTSIKNGPILKIQDAGTAGALAGFGQHTLAKLAGREGAGGSARGMVVRHNSPSRSHRTGLKVCS